MLLLSSLPPTITSFLISLNYESVFPAIFGEDMSGYQDIFILLTIFVFFRGIQLVITQLCFIMSTNNVSFYANLSGLLAGIIAIFYMRGYSDLYDVGIAINVALIMMILVTVFIMFKKFRNIKNTT